MRLLALRAVNKMASIVVSRILARNLKAIRRGDCDWEPRGSWNELIFQTYPLLQIKWELVFD